MIEKMEVDPNFPAGRLERVFRRSPGWRQYVFLPETTGQIHGFESRADIQAQFKTFGIKFTDFY